jgi:hypothetical protein
MRLDFAPRPSSNSGGERMNNTSSSKFWWVVLPSLWVGHISALAQEDISEGPLPYNFQSGPVGPTTSGSVQSGTPYMGTSGLAGSSFNLGDYASAGTGLALGGPFRLYPELGYLFTYGNGLQAQPGVNSTTAISTVSENLLLRIGSHWSIDYTPRQAFYSNPLFRDTTDQSVSLIGGTTYGDWTLNLSQSYVDTTQPLVETGTQVDQVAYATALNAAWQMNGHLSLQLGLNQNFRFENLGSGNFGSGLSDMHEWTTSDWLNYQFERQLGAAIGVTGGYDEVGLGSDMPFEEVQGRVNFQPGSKLVLTVTGGVEDRQFIHPYAPSLVAPIFSAIAQYQVLEGTSLSLSGSRTVTPSFFGNEVNVITSVMAGVRQHIVGTMFFSINGGYTSEPYTSIVPGPLPPYYFGVPTTTYLVQTRSDTRTDIRVSLSAAFRTRLTGSIFYTRNDNTSSQSNFAYSGNQVGLQLNYRF